MIRNSSSSSSTAEDYDASAWKLLEPKSYMDLSRIADAQVQYIPEVRYLSAREAKKLMKENRSLVFTIHKNSSTQRTTLKNRPSNLRCAHFHVFGPEAEGLVEIEFIDGLPPRIIVVFADTISREKASTTLDGVVLHVDNRAVTLRAQIHSSNGGGKLGRAMLRTSSTGSTLKAHLEHWFTNRGTVPAENVLHEAYNEFSRMALWVRDVSLPAWFRKQGMNRLYRKKGLIPSEPATGCKICSARRQITTPRSNPKVEKFLQPGANDSSHAVTAGKMSQEGFSQQSKDKKSRRKRLGKERKTHMLKLHKPQAVTSSKESVKYTIGDLTMQFTDLSIEDEETPIDTLQSSNIGAISIEMNSFINQAADVGVGGGNSAHNAGRDAQDSQFLGTEFRKRKTPEKSKSDRKVSHNYRVNFDYLHC